MKKKCIGLGVWLLAVLLLSACDRQNENEKSGQTMAPQPQITVKEGVILGGMAYDAAATELTLTADACTFEELLAALPQLTDLKSLHLPATRYSTSQLTQLAQACPSAVTTHTVMLLEQEYAGDTAMLDLSATDPSHIQQIVDAAASLPALTDVQLGSAYALLDVKQLMDAMPGVTVHYSFDLFGKTVNTTDERVEFVNVPIGNDGVAQIRQALDILPKCQYFKLDRCGIDNATMEKLRDDYPETKIVWRVFFAFYNCLTDTEVLRCIRKLDDENVEVLKYCTDVKYLDMGHNVDLANFEFIKYMPKLEIAIVVDSQIPSLEPFGNCPNLQWLEIVNCQKLTDLSPLANCTHLKGLNMSANFRLDDLTPLYGLQEMERLFLGHQDLTEEDVKAVKTALPNCWVSINVRSSDVVSYNYSYGWRLEEDGSHAEWYKFVREIFRYDDNYYNHYNNDGQ